MRVAVLSSSLDPESRSRRLARHAADRFEARGDTVRFIDARSTPLPVCDNDRAWRDPAVATLRDAIAEADLVHVSFGIYNYAPSAAAKLLVELGGEAWNDRVVAFAAAAGGRGSLVAVTDLAPSLMLERRCVIVPRFVYAVPEDFEADTLSTTVRAAIGEQVDAAARLAGRDVPDSLIP